MTDQELNKLHEGFTEDQFFELARMRGGCWCYIWAPCARCVKPLTEDEAAAMGLLEKAPSAKRPAKETPKNPHTKG